MAEVTEPLREEHQRLLPQIDNLRAVADSIGALPRAALQRRLDEVYDFLAHHLILHAEAEEEFLYPAVGKALGLAQATVTMSRDHVEVSRLTEQLRGLRARLGQADFDDGCANELRRVLYGLYSVVKLHLAKEEEILAPILDAHLNEADAHGLLHQLAEATHGGGHRH